MTIIEATNAIAMITNLTSVIETTNATIALDVTTRTQKVPSPTTRRMIARAITSRKRAMRPCIMTSPLSQAPAICPEKGVDLIQDLLCTLNLGLALAQVARATTIIMLTKILNLPFKRMYSYFSKSDDGGRIHCLDKSNTVFATFSAPNAKKKHTQK
jgi:hypothetical protein